MNHKITFIGIGSTEKYSCKHKILYCMDDIDTLILIQTFMSDNNLNINMDSIESTDSTLFLVDTNTGDSVNNKFLFWLKKNGWNECNIHNYEIIQKGE